MANTLTGVNLPNYQINSATGAAGQFLTTVGYNGSSWTSASINNSPTITVSNEPASLDVKGKIVHNGRDLEERLNTIETILQIPERDVILEKKYPKLKKMYDDYIKELSKARMWESLKGENND